MRLSALLASVGALVLATSTATVSAQAVEPPPSEACKVCATTAAIAVSSTCTYELLSTDNTPALMTLAERTCYCPLTTSVPWLQPCVTKGVCTSGHASRTYATFTSYHNIICNGISTPPPTTGPPTTNPLPPLPPPPVIPTYSPPPPPPPVLMPTGVTTTRGPANPTGSGSLPVSAANSRFGASSPKILASVAFIVVAAAGTLL
ncbi:hypothetical protein BGZ95_010006 [Linnemannia exigua]|uniref:Uncharacterized protein n=1 Tax=Linnemannia exigua TaxID=604196 RepID=A0AAD4H7G2_9FUNG|nr:hypothetical protein BGZ95_010006 [Linnemannia exigua]